VAGGFGASSASEEKNKWVLTTVYAPETVTRAESFVWYRPDERLQVGVAYLWRQGAFRGLANYIVIPEGERHPDLRVGLGLQGIGTGNPGYFVTSEKNFSLPEGRLNAYVGVGFRANENHGHPLGGVKFTPPGPWTLGIQHDGHAAHPFIIYDTGGSPKLGLYLIEGRSLGFMISLTR
jgi:hypothetical protein